MRVSIGFQDGPRPTVAFLQPFIDAGRELGIQGQHVASVVHAAMKQRLVTAEAERGFELHSDIGRDGQIAFRRAARSCHWIAEDEVFGRPSGKADDDLGHGPGLRFQRVAVGLDPNDAALLGFDGDHRNAPCAHPQMNQRMPCLVHRHAPAKRFRPVQPSIVERPDEVVPGELPSCASGLQPHLPHQALDIGSAAADRETGERPKLRRERRGRGNVRRIGVGRTSHLRSLRVSVRQGRRVLLMPLRHAWPVSTRLAEAIPARRRPGPPTVGGH